MKNCLQKQQKHTFLISLVSQNFTAQ